MDRDPIVSTTNNFDAVNKHIDNLSARQRDLINFHRLAKFRSFVVSLSILALAASTSYLIYSYTSKPVEKNSEGISIGDLIESNQSLIPSTKPKGKDTQAVQSVTVDFTVFQQVNLDGDERIVTGWKYKPDDIENPVYEFCYHDEPLDGAARKTTNLASRSGGGAIIWDRTSIKLQKLGESNCRFRQ